MAVALAKIAAFLLSTKLGPVAIKILVGIPLIKWRNLAIAYYIIMICCAVLGVVLSALSIFNPN